MRLALPLILLLCNPLLAQGINERPNFLNPDLPVEMCIDDLIPRMTLEEKVSQMVNSEIATRRADYHLRSINQ